MLPKIVQRRALNPLTVNTMASKGYSSENGKSPRKRTRDEFEDLELLPRAKKVRSALQQTADPGDRAIQHAMQTYRQVFIVLLRPLI